MPKWPKDTAALVFVHIAAFGAAWFVHTQSPRMPLYDEWMLLDQYVQSPDLWSWIIAHHNEHRFPLTKAIWIGILRQTGFRFDEPQYLTFGLNASAGVLALWTARWRQGRSHPLDAILPMLFLHFGHGLNWVMGYQLGFALMAYCTVGWMWTAAAFGREFRVRWAISSAAYTVPILLCGGFGLGFAPAIALWWLYLAARFFRLRAPVAALAIGFGAALTIGYSAFNYLTLPPLIGPATSPFDQPLDVLGVAAGFLLVGLGPWPTYENPFSILAPIVGIPVVLAYGFGSLALARRIWHERAADAGRVALALVILGTLILAFAAGRSRPAAIIDRYAVVSACGLVALYLSRVRPAMAGRSRKSMAIWGAAAALVAGGLYLVNREPGIHGAYRLRESSHGVAEEIEAREAPIFIMGRHSGNISMMSADRDFGLLRLRDAGIPPFDRLPDDPVFRRNRSARSHRRSLGAAPKRSTRSSGISPGSICPDRCPGRWPSASRPTRSAGGSDENFTAMDRRRDRGDPFALGLSALPADRRLFGFQNRPRAPRRLAGGRVTHRGARIAAVRMARRPRPPLIRSRRTDRG